MQYPYKSVSHDGGVRKMEPQGPPMHVGLGGKYDPSMMNCIPLAPFPQQARKGSPFDTASFVLGILAICVHWIVLLKWGVILFAIPLVLSVLAITFGSFSAFKVLLSKKIAPNSSDKTGLAGFALGILSMIFSTSWLLLAQTFLWGWRW